MQANSDEPGSVFEGIVTCLAQLWKSWQTRNRGMRIPINCQVNNPYLGDKRLDAHVLSCYYYLP